LISGPPNDIAWHSLAAIGYNIGKPDPHTHRYDLPDFTPEPKHVPRLKNIGVLSRFATSGKGAGLARAHHSLDTPSNATLERHARDMHPDPGFVAGWSEPMMKSFRSRVDRHYSNVHGMDGVCNIPVTVAADGTDTRKDLRVNPKTGQAEGGPMYSNLGGPLNRTETEVLQKDFDGVFEPLRRMWEGEGELTLVEINGIGGYLERNSSTVRDTAKVYTSPPHPSPRLSFVYPRVLAKPCRLLTCISEPCLSKPPGKAAKGTRKAGAVPKEKPRQKYRQRPHS